MLNLEDIPVEDVVSVRSGMLMLKMMLNVLGYLDETPAERGWVRLEVEDRIYEAMDLLNDRYLLTAMMLLVGLTVLQSEGEKLDAEIAADLGGDDEII